MQTSIQDRMQRAWKQWLRPFLIIGVLLLGFRSSVADWNDVPTGSMKPSILEGDRIFVNKLAYDLKVPFTTWRLAQWDDPQRGDIVVFFSPTDGRRLVKRVVALPGDTLALRQGLLVINGQRATYAPLPEDLAAKVPEEERPGHLFAAERMDGQSHPVMATPQVPAVREFGPVVVPEDHYFVLGDNRDNSADSRFIGPIPRYRIVGRASTVVLSLDREEYYLPRWGRFFTALP